MVDGGGGSVEVGTAAVHTGVVTLKQFKIGFNSRSMEVVYSRDIKGIGMSQSCIELPCFVHFYMESELLIGTFSPALSQLVRSV